MKRALGALILFILFSGVYNSAVYCDDAASASRIQRSQEILEKEKALRERIERGEKVFIRKIIVSGVTLINKDDIKNALSPFKNQWLSMDEIQGILDSIKATYEQGGYPCSISDISYQVEKNTLKIIIEEKVTGELSGV